MGINFVWSVIFGVSVWTQNLKQRTTAFWGFEETRSKQ